MYGDGDSDALAAAVAAHRSTGASPGQGSQGGSPPQRAGVTRTASGHNVYRVDTNSPPPPAPTPSPKASHGRHGGARSGGSHHHTPPMLAHSPIVGHPPPLPSPDAASEDVFDPNAYNRGGGGGGVASHGSGAPRSRVVASVTPRQKRGGDGSRPPRGSAGRPGRPPQPVKASGARAPSPLQALGTFNKTRGTSSGTDVETLMREMEQVAASVVPGQHPHQQRAAPTGLGNVPELDVSKRSPRNAAKVSAAAQVGCSFVG